MMVIIVLLILQYYRLKFIEEKYQYLIKEREKVVLKFWKIQGFY